MGTPEHRIKERLKRRLADELPHLYQFWPVQNGLGAPTLDCLLCCQGFFCAIETKAPGKKLTARQEDTSTAIHAADGLVFVVDSEDAIEDVVQSLARLTR